MRKLVNKLKGGVLFTCLNAFALLLAIQNVNVTCLGYQHQPKVPQQALKYKKYK